ncbi:hypothetical protein SCP_0904390 [Sparassis crispa]|uniref:Uncharacterized protein n=1 Tax=Sparassis crispa TaxID=139825 RepID=A0A401GWI3_9APHY|nr:hypothetical protein SCP_0904390 [Sparassis crispa]GBE86560.1 hypothetical protein SCP_0904390 [Sparassis crispa]
MAAISNNQSTLPVSPYSSSSCTAIFPVTISSVSALAANLRTLLVCDLQLSEIVLVSPRSLHGEIRKILRTVFSTEESRDVHTELSLLSWLPDTDEDMVILRAARQATADFVLLLDSSGLKSVENGTHELLLSFKSTSIDLPIGPHGFASVSSNLTCLSASDQPESAVFLVPPLIMPSSLVPDIDLTPDPTYGVWYSLGEQVARARSDMSGGLVIGSRAAGSEWCPFDQMQDLHRAPVDPSPFDPFDMLGLDTIQLSPNLSVHQSSGISANMADSSSSFLLLFPSLRDLRMFSPAACRLLRHGYRLHALLYAEAATRTKDFVDAGDHQVFSDADCRLKYESYRWPESGFKAESDISDWLQTLGPAVDVIIASSDRSQPSFYIDLLLEYRRNHDRPSMVHIPQGDLPYCDWMGTLSLQEWMDWHMPQVDISVVTNDRPWSLNRLLSSLSSARYFGDSLDLRINLDQTADPETLDLVDEFEWEHGRVSIHHRVIHGGLLPAVVESWYPHSNHSYGLILEDDVEVSPLFYAWIKMSILRYRYGAPQNVSPQLFGISLYQQKHLELRPEGRHAFNARSAFAAANLPDPITPYLSQIPCSWGAVYFPEQWREFHAYLAFRLSEYAWDVDEAVVPAVRSNNWSRSWKKYFIELVYLRGYVMLYPNYEDYISLSTNHLEAGSHVKDVPSETYLRKKRLFLLPLMALPDVIDWLSPLVTGLLDLPGGTLPRWQEMPVLDLLGLPTAEESLVQRGRLRRDELTGCVDSPITMHDAADLLCLQNTVFQPTP